VITAILFKGLSLAGIYFLISFGVTFLYGVGGFPNLAIGPIGLVGAYVTATLLRDNFAVVTALSAGSFCSVILGIAVQKFVVEPLYNSTGGGDRGRIFVLYGTFGLLLIFPPILLNIFRSTMMTLGLPTLGFYKLGSTVIGGYEILAILSAVCILIITHWVFTKTVYGTRVRAVTQHPLLSTAIGINVGRIYLITAVVSSICAFIGAVLWGQIFSLELSSGASFTLYGFIIAVMGGLGSLNGAFIVSLVLGLALSATSYTIGGVYEYIITTILLILVLIIKPKGIVPTRREV